MTEAAHFGAEPLRLGMVGGGQGAMIGAIHRYAARMDGAFVLTAGALSSDPVRAKVSAQELGILPERTYSSFQEMARVEAVRADGIDAVAIVTPNHMHFPVAQAFLEAGIHVICDKPLTSRLEDAERLAEIAAKSDSMFILTHNYSAYPMIREARAMVQAGALGKLRLVQAEYAQDWLSEDLEQTGQKQAAWRTDPEQAGGGAIGDIGTHAFQLTSFVTGLVIDELSAELTTFVRGRKVDDNAHIMLRFAGGARGMLWISQVAPGCGNGLKLRVYGEKAGIEWEQENPERLWHTPLNQPKTCLLRGGAGTSAASSSVSRTPSGHPEGYLEAFANLYSAAAEAIRARKAGEPVSAELQLPGIEDGLAGMRFVIACQRSSASNGSWTDV